MATVFGFFAVGFGFFVVSITLSWLQAANSAGQESLPISFEPLRFSFVLRQLRLRVGERREVRRQLVALGQEALGAGARPGP